MLAASCTLHVQLADLDWIGTAKAPTEYESTIPTTTDRAPARPE